MKFETTPAFDRDYRRLTPRDRAIFHEVVATKFAPACETLVTDPAARWPASVRVKPVTNAPGILEMTWSFAGPDGRATFELITVSGELRCRWRRIGKHNIFREP